MSKMRNLDVDGASYRFIIGKSFVAIRRKGDNRDVPRTEFVLPDSSYVEDGPITPGMVADYIRDGKVKSPEHYFPACDCEGVAKWLCANPFAVEIDQKVHYVVLCDNCFEKIADDI